MEPSEKQQGVSVVKAKIKVKYFLLYFHTEKLLNMIIKFVFLCIKIIFFYQNQ